MKHSLDCSMFSVWFTKARLVNERIRWPVQELWRVIKPEHIVIIFHVVFIQQRVYLLQLPTAQAQVQHDVASNAEK